jgi:hypothetical protein
MLQPLAPLGEIQCYSPFDERMTECVGGKADKATMVTSQESALQAHGLPYIHMHPTDHELLSRVVNGTGRFLPGLSGRAAWGASQPAIGNFACSRS